MDEHLQEEKHNNQGCLMRIVEYNKSNDIIVEFQDEHKTRVHSIYNNFKSGSIKNPYYPSVYEVGIIGTKYPRSVNCRNIKEYETWRHILRRCYDNELKGRQPTYNDVSCCNEWLCYENFYEWLHKQSNFNKWYEGKRWAVDKDIFTKRNKVYSPENCCLVPQNVNCLFLKREAERGEYPIGVRYTNDGFLAVCRNPFLDSAEELGYYSTPERAFNAYKVYKEDIIKQVAEIEYENGNITKECYEAMLNYVVEIDD
jgi:hypothetical protein